MFESLLLITRILNWCNFVFVDAISATSFHPTFPLIASCSGQRKFKLIGGDKLENDQNITSDNSLKIWRAEGNYAWCYYSSEGEIVIHPVTNLEGEENASKENNFENHGTINIDNETSLNADIEIIEEQVNNSNTVSDNRSDNYIMTYVKFI